MNSAGRLRPGQTSHGFYKVIETRAMSEVRVHEHQFRGGKNGVIGNEHDGNVRREELDLLRQL